MSLLTADGVPAPLPDAELPPLLWPPGVEAGTLSAAERGGEKRRAADVALIGSPIDGAWLCVCMCARMGRCFGVPICCGGGDAVSVMPPACCM
jgi:hypothetical protein